MCRKLDIRIIAANSPQAKGRVERGNGTHQDRLIKKMGRKKIRTHEAANRFLQEEYWPNTTHGLRASRPRRRTITASHRQRGNWSKCPFFVFSNQFESRDAGDCRSSALRGR